MSDKPSDNNNRHVIILGSGASMGSGYPSADQLRVLLSSPEAILDAYKKSYPLESDPKSTSLTADQIRRAKEILNLFKDQIELFRKGGFGSVDEFCKLSKDSPEFSKHVGEMRKLTRIALMAHNPEDSFEKSEYYPFVQRLYEPPLANLKRNTTVLSYNYDTYLDFVLWASMETRKKIAGKEFTTDDRNSISSGLFDPNNPDWLKKDDSFVFLKLHGSICYPTTDFFTTRYTYNSAFPPRKESSIRFDSVFPKDSQVAQPKIIFPWEITKNGELIELDEFSKLIGQSPSNPDYARYFGIWQRAKNDIAKANRISIIGLNVHHFMNEGLQILFKDVPLRGVKFDFVNPTNPKKFLEGYTDSPKLKAHRHTAAARFFRLLEESARDASSLEARLMEKFWDFIQEEMDN